ncbi:class I SAM-dependent DNA methyltransferase [bacterium]|nr:class I SAM-dependent DNA methyltransferase [bacterium]
MKAFVSFVRSHIKGDEKGEAQIFCDRLFQAFGYAGIMEAGGTLEFRIHKAKGTRFADLLWKPRLLLEMKKRGEKLERHYRQAFEYWLDLVPDRPQYVILCNFDEFWIYDLNHQLDEPMDRVKLDELPERYTALNFLFPEQRKPLFDNDRVAVTRQAAKSVATLFNKLVSRKLNPVPAVTAQRFALQSVLALFAEDIGLLPRGLFSELVQDCKAGDANSYDIIGGLFRQMADTHRASGGRYKGVDYFNGGLFSVVEPLELKADEICLLEAATKENWAKVHPAIFGSLFEGSMNQDERHAFGAHFTSETDIYKVVLPTIVRPWRERIAATTKASDLLALRTELLDYRVLDPACGSGNFLYIAYREVKRIELELLEKIYTNFGRKSKRAAGGTSLVSASQFFGIDIKEFAVELAKVTLMLAKTLALKETRERLATGQQHLPFDLSELPLPLDNLDSNFWTVDALMNEDGSIREWPQVDAIIGNPPFLGAKRLKPMRGASYVNELRKGYPEVPGMADYCVFWFRRAHEHLPECTTEKPTSGRAGLVGTQNVRNNQSRVGGLDHIASSGTVVEAIDNQPWSGEANVHVSIVNWVKTKDEAILPKSRRLWTQANKSGTKRSVQAGADDNQPTYELVFRDVPFINSSLSDEADVSGKVRLSCNLSPKRCFQGKIPGYEGFMLDRATANRLQGDSAEVIFPYLTGRELLDAFKIERWVIDFGNRGMVEAAAFKSAFAHCKHHVLPAVEQSLRDAEASDSDMASARREHLTRWWQLWNRRDELSASLKTMPRYIGCSRVTRRPVMVFISSSICPSDLVQVFALDDDYSFGILQSTLHFEWFRKSSRMKVESDTRYSVRDVFETFPWPQAPSLRQVKRVVAASRVIREVREKAIATTGGGLRDLYRTLELPGKHPLREAHEELDDAVREAYGISAKAQELTFLIALNHSVNEAIAAGNTVQKPGLPTSVTTPNAFVSTDAYEA